MEKNSDNNPIPLHGDPADQRTRSLDSTNIKKLDEKLKAIFGEGYGPRPISIENYRRRGIKTVQQQKKKKGPRGGKAAAARAEIGNLKRVIRITSNIEQKNILIQQLKKRTKEEKERVKDKSLDKNIDSMFNNLFKLAEKTYAKNYYKYVIKNVNTYVII